MVVKYCFIFQSNQSLSQLLSKIKNLNNKKLDELDNLPAKYK